MKKILNIVLFVILLMFFYSGCDTGKKGLQEKKTETTQKTEPVQLQKSESKPFKKTEKVLYTLVCAKNGINIRTGPGTNYSKDGTGQTMKGEKFYVLEEKNGWIRFRVSITDIGWSGWVLKRLVEEKHTFIGPFDLEEDARYRLSRETPLVKVVGWEIDCCRGPWHLKAIPPGGIVKVLWVVRKGENTYPWYYVDYFSDEVWIRRGWIDSIDLLDQSLERIK